MKSQPPVRLQPRLSRYLLGLLTLAHGGALLLVLFVPLVWWSKVMLCIAISMSLFITVRGAALLNPSAIVFALWDSAGIWTLRSLNGQEFEAQLLPGSYVMPHLIILNFKLDTTWQHTTWRRRAMILLPDTVDADTLRQLRIRLLHGGDQSPE